MQPTAAHRALAEKFAFKSSVPDVMVADSLVELAAFLFTEEEALVASALAYAPLPGFSIARRVKRPADEAGPILESLSERLLIVGSMVAGVKVYSFLPLWPGIFETQMLRHQNFGGDDEHYRQFAKLFEQVYDEYFTWIKPRLEGKDARFVRIVPIEASLESAVGIVPLATDRYSEIIDRNNSFCLVSCPCRHEYRLLGKGCDKPMEVCSAMGYLADMAVEKGVGRRVSKQEFVEAKMMAAQAGLINMTDNLKDPLQVCSCCSCCCSSLRMVKEYNIPTLLAKSHFEAAIDGSKCEICGSCVEPCPMDAIALGEEKAAVDYSRCIGCGLCVGNCSEGAITLKEREGHKPPSENVYEYYSNRYTELTGDTNAFIPRLSLGFSRTLGKTAPFSISGPKYKPKK